MAESNLALAAGKVKLGDLTVSRIGLGTNRITDTTESRALLKRAVELGVEFIDTAHRYGAGASETTIGNTLSPYPPGVVIATKGGFDKNGPAGSSRELRKHLEESLRRLKTDCVDLYQLHRIDPRIPIEESITALKTFQSEGKIRHIGLSEVSVEQLARAQKVAKIVSVQNEYNILERRHEELVEYCSKHSIVFIPWFPLGGLSGGAEKVAASLVEIAKKYQAAPQQIAIAWLLKRSPVILPIPGTLSIAHLKANLQSGSIDLSEGDYSELSDIK